MIDVKMREVFSKVKMVRRNLLAS